MTNLEFVAKLNDIADNYKTLYVSGCFGAPLNSSTVGRYLAISSNSKRTANINAAANKSPPVFGFDCVCLIKGVLWGWSGDASKSYGGAVYQSGGVPDIGENDMIAKCAGLTSDFSKIEIGEAVWLPGHIGVYIGDGIVIECTPSWTNNVQKTACLNIGEISGMNGRKWDKHGKLPYITYVEDEEMTQEQFNAMMDNYFAAQAKKDTSAWSDKEGYWKKATDTKIFDGTAPQAPLTREQAATVFGRMGLIK